uniref:Uncharacterized protein n=1 Tax=Arundo donax TaxID=35708 RepID=A0A0A9GZE8_ARUDO
MSIQVSEVSYLLLFGSGKSLIELSKK